MTIGTSIEWTEVTWNPTTGCDRITLGCDNCYALTLSKRLKAMGAEKYQNPLPASHGFWFHPSRRQGFRAASHRNRAGRAILRGRRQTAGPGSSIR